MFERNDALETILTYVGPELPRPSSSTEITSHDMALANDAIVFILDDGFHHTTVVFSRPMVYKNSYDLMVIEAVVNTVRKHFMAELTDEDRGRLEIIEQHVTERHTYLNFQQNS